MPGATLLLLNATGRFARGLHGRQQQHRGAGALVHELERARETVDLAGRNARDDAGKKPALDCAAHLQTTGAGLAGRG